MVSLLGFIIRHQLRTLLFLYTFSTQTFLLALSRVLLPHLPRYQTLRQQIRRAYLLSAGTDFVHRLPSTASQEKARPINGEKWKGYLIPGTRSLQQFTEPSVDVRVNEGKRVVVLYAHGGGYGWGEARMYLNYMVRWIERAKRDGIDVCFLSVEYPLSSEASYPAQQTSFINAYQYLLNEGIRPNQIVFAGDSAGGHLSIQSGIALLSANLPQPACSILISPWLDFSFHSFEGGNALVETDYVASANTIVPQLVDAFIGKSGHSTTSPDINPLYRKPTQLHGLNPQLIFVGAAEFALQDSRQWNGLLETAGVVHELVTEKGELHIYAMGSKWLTERVRERTDEKIFGWIGRWTS